MTIGETKTKYNIMSLYDAFEPWLNESGYTVNDLPLSAETEDGEFVIISAYNQDGERVYKTTTAQSNGWLRTNIYYKDGTCEELYEKEGI